MEIEKTERKFLDGVEYVRVYFEESNIFDEVPIEIYREWKEQLGHTGGIAGNEELLK
ncbi:MAG: hypothetical protein L3J21_09860 [Devosiaceae bacterium]|nr:hypothetical protein [Devosiaceae bacterium]